jgi:DNA repair exonuclease SbcCD ATPase subunit
VIPLRVYLENFLCHLKQEFRFDDHPVWLLYGPNGVGKSAVFDAMIYALFGESQRSDAKGRSNSKEDIIRHGAASMSVEFDFEHERRRYRVWRMRPRKGSVKQGVDYWLGDRWTPVPNVNSDRDLKVWVSQTLGLTYETFVSALLLRQGAAEKLIDADKNERREVLRSFIDLDPYLQLWERVKAGRTNLSADVRRLKVQLDGMPFVTDEQVQAAEAAVQATEEQQKAAKSAEAVMRDLVGHARQWEVHDRERQELEAKLSAAQERLGRANGLKTQMDRLTQLRAFVTPLRQAVTLRNELKVAEASWQRCSKEHAEAVASHEKLSAELETNQQYQEKLREEINALERDIQANVAEQDQLGKEIVRAEHASQLMQKLAVLRKKQFAPRLDEECEQAGRDVAEARSANEALPYLEELVKQRDEARRAHADEMHAKKQLDTLAAQVERLSKADKVAKEADAGAAALTGEKQQHLAIARDQLRQAEARKERFASTAEQPTCSECGQEISAEHVRKERAKLTKEVKRATEQLRDTQEQADAAAKAASFAERGRKKAEEALREAEQQQSTVTRDHEEARRRWTQAKAAWERARSQLPTEWAKQVRDITEVKFPTEEDSQRLRTVAKQMSVSERKFKVLEEAVRDRCQTQRDMTTIEQSIQALGAPQDVNGAQRKIGELKDKESDLRKRLQEIKSAQTSTSLAVKQTADQHAELAKKMNRFAGDVGKAEADVTSLRRRGEAAALAVPTLSTDSWENAETLLQDASGELQQLEASQVEQEYKSLDGDRACLAEWQSRLAEVVGLIAGVPEQARRPAATVQGEVRVAAEALAEAEDAYKQAWTKRHTLHDKRGQRYKTERELADAERKHTLHDRLVELLGPTGLQLDLVRGAEHRIIERANDILGRLSCDTMRFEPPDAESTQTFELSVRRSGCPEPIAVANLSGGERFRVAVALALSVCQGAGEVTKPLETVIIDEGFGVLDREGRMAMIAELRDGQGMTRLFKKVIVVSHQDDFAAAFPVGYRLSFEDGATRVEPFGLNGAS